MIVQHVVDPAGMRVVPPTVFSVFTSHEWHRAFHRHVGREQDERDQVQLWDVPGPRGRRDIVCIPTIPEHPKRNLFRRSTVAGGTPQGDSCMYHRASSPQKILKPWFLVRRLSPARTVSIRGRATIASFASKAPSNAPSFTKTFPRTNG